MEKGQAIKVAVGVGAVGTALAYLGYSYYNQEPDTANITAESETKTFWNELWSNSNTEEGKDNVDEGQEMKDLKGTSAGIVEKDITSNAWGTFWKKSFEEKNVVIEKKDEKED